MTTNYIQEPRDFLEKAKTTFSIVQAVPQVAPLWCKDGDKHGIKYSVTLKNDRGAYTFDYWGCIADAEKVELAIKAQEHGSNSRYYFEFSNWLKSKNIKPASKLILTYKKTAADLAREIITPNEYDVLACLMVTDDTFEEFCASFGYDEDSRNAYKTYKEVLEQSNNLRRLFTHEELDALSEIN